MAKKRVLLGAAYSAIEPLGLLHLAGLARDEGWERKFHLVKEHDYDEFFEKVRDYKPDLVGFTVFTGNHLQLHEALGRLRKDHPNIQTALGGYHPTYFPTESVEHADFVVMSEGFQAFRQILKGTAQRGIIPLKELGTFPFPDRATFYEDYPEHGRSKIKSMITQTGCPYGCTYCYNSSSLGDLKISPKVAEAFVKQGMGERLFPLNVRNLDDILKEGRELAEKWPTEVIYFQDDVFGFDEKAGGFLDQLAETWPEQVGIPFHAQMRWEMTNSDRRLELVREAGGFGLTLAIEAADPDIRKKILDRGMDDELVFEGMEKIIKLGYKGRTEQITGLPWGITPNITSMNLDADLEILEYNIRLRGVTGGPTMSWASTYVPYLGTKSYNTCEEYGFYSSDNSDVKDTFFERSVLRFLREWMGPKRIKKFKDDPSIWLPEDELERYRDQNAELRRNFNFFALMPQGHVLARAYLTSSEPYSFERLGRDALTHLNAIAGKDREAAEILSRVGRIASLNGRVSLNPQEHALVSSLAPYFATLPQGEKTVERFLTYGRRNNDYSEDILSRATRHELYESTLYNTSPDDRRHELPTARQSGLK